MTRREELLRAMQEATASYAAAKERLADAKFLQRNGMANNLTFAVAAEHSAYHRWLRAGEAIEKHPEAKVPKALPPVLSTSANRSSPSVAKHVADPPQQPRVAHAKPARNDKAAIDFLSVLNDRLGVDDERYRELHGLPPSRSPRC